MSRADALADPEEYMREQDERLGLNISPTPAVLALPEVEPELKDPADFANALLDDMLSSTISQVTQD